MGTIIFGGIKHNNQSTITWPCWYRCD